MNTTENLQVLYQIIKPQIEKRLIEFNRVWLHGSEHDIYKELIFCLFTPQSKAERCWQAVEELEEKNLFYNTNCQEIAACIRTFTRFHHTKARNVIYFHREVLQKVDRSFRKQLESFDDNKSIREWLVENIKGMGYKEASHFLRNIGMGANLVILDRHILRKLMEFRIIEKLPTSLNTKTYIEIETKMKAWATSLHMPVTHLDLLLWYQTTSKIFK